MRLATIVDGGRPVVAVVRDDRALPLGRPEPGLDSMRALAASGEHGLRRVAAWVERQPDAAFRSLAGLELGPVVPDPGAVYAIGLNYGPVTSLDPGRPPRPLVYGKLPTSVAGHGAIVSWDRRLTGSVDAEVELGIVIGAPARAVGPDEAPAHVFGYTVINDISSRDPWLDGDQWLLGKSMTGFCPAGPVVVTTDELAVDDLRLGCTLNGRPIQDGSTRELRFSVAEIVSYVSHHAELRPGDLIATGTPARLAAPPGPDRHLEAGDVVTTWIERIGELTITIA